jgi:hypothetical protein
MMADGDAPGVPLPAALQSPETATIQDAQGRYAEAQSNAEALAAWKQQNPSGPGKAGVAPQPTQRLMSVQTATDANGNVKRVPSYPGDPMKPVQTVQQLMMSREQAPRKRSGSN